MDDDREHDEHEDDEQDEDEDDEDDEDDEAEDDEDEDEVDLDVPDIEAEPAVTAPLHDVTDEEKDLEPVGVMPGAGPEEPEQPQGGTARDATDEDADVTEQEESGEE